MQRLLRKFETAKSLVPAPIRRDAQRPTRLGAIYFGSTSAAMREALEVLKEQGVDVDVMRIRAFPFSDKVVDFVLAHDQTFLIEQNRDAQLRTLLVNECDLDPTRLISVLHFDGTPITARFIADKIGQQIHAMRGGASREAAE